MTGSSRAAAAAKSSESVAAASVTPISACSVRPPAAGSTSATKPVMTPLRRSRRTRSAAALELSPTAAPRSRQESRPSSRSRRRISLSVASMATIIAALGQMVLHPAAPAVRNGPWIRTPHCSPACSPAWRSPPGSRSSRSPPTSPFEGSSALDQTAWTARSRPGHDGSFAPNEARSVDVTVRSATRDDGGVPAPGPSHPLQRLGADEIRLARTVLAEHGLVGEHTRFTYLGLEEPPKWEVLSFRNGDPLERRVRAILLDTATGAATDVVASLSRGTVDSQVVIDTARDGQPPIVLEDLTAVDEIVKGDGGWRAAMARRGVTDLDLVRPCPLSAGSFGVPGEEGRRMLRVLSFVQHHEKDHPWAHPVDGLVAYVDLVERRVVRLVDEALLPVPPEEGNFDDPAAVGPARTSLKPIEITQPEGPSFTLDGDEVSWEGWRLRIGFDAREGLTLHQISLWDRAIVYRASIAEMVVPYADPSPARFWQNYFDAGEYNLGQQVNSLMLGCDCLGEIRYFDVALPTEGGEPREVANAICIHEEDVGVAWKHSDLFTGSAETRRQRRLVISTFLAIGNYDYGFYWYLYLDGTIELEVKATGVVFTSSYVEGSRWATQLAPGLGGPHHQHMFSARLDMTVDGVDNAVDEVQLERLPMGPDNPYGNAFTRRVTRLTRESEGARTADASVGRAWHVVNPSKTNRLGQPVAGVRAGGLGPDGAVVLLARHHRRVRRAVPARRHLDRGAQVLRRRPAGRECLAAAGRPGPGAARPAGHGVGRGCQLRDAARGGAGLDRDMGAPRRVRGGRGHRRRLRCVAAFGAAGGLPANRPRPRGDRPARTPRAADGAGGNGGGLTPPAFTRPYQAASAAPRSCSTVPGEVTAVPACGRAGNRRPAVVASSRRRPRT